MFKNMSFLDGAMYLVLFALVVLIITHPTQFATAVVNVGNTVNSTLGGYASGNFNSNVKLAG